MNSYKEIEELDHTDNSQACLNSLTRAKFSEIELMVESLPKIAQNSSRENEFKNPEFLILIKKQINDLIYKDKEIGYNILLIGRRKNNSK